MWSDNWPAKSAARLPIMCLGGMHLPSLEPRWVRERARAAMQRPASPAVLMPCNAAATFNEELSLRGSGVRRSRAPRQQVDTRRRLTDATGAFHPPSWPAL